ncbi:Crp/Fnr family transcriptional regulator [Litoreibacter meonggei]|uniref:Crp/Fnr family transcriptional regulator n=1 Tax=Litoreibacter meonggei TaxID=1049199 RepID=UPI000EB4BD21|nr:Crp/Fnr family transcriptional regulator [Litoreibacter meonggei]
MLDHNLLRDLPRETQSEFLDSCKRRSFKPTNVMLRQGELTDRMYMVAEGRVEVSYVNETGHNSIIYHAMPGQVLGTVETLSERPCAGTCTALSDTTVLICRRADLFDKMTSPIFVRNFAADLHDVLTHDNRFKSVDQFFSAEQKICAYLDKLSDIDDVFKESQGYLADVAGCSRQTVNKELGRLRDRGVVEMSKSGIRILDYDALSQRLSELGEHSPKTTPSS